MHIPDGYLSPVTCASLYGAAAPFWYVALRKLRTKLHTRLVPLLSLFAAFSFVIMMFNIPLPGGTSGHAIGLGISAAVLGPWASMIAISIALLIQAILFGDGGVTALGANCFNMAIAGSLTAWLVYRAISGSSPITSRRRVVGCALGGYVAINVAALLAAIEFGIQPLLFKDASGAPLYAPYPLSISIPAMMIGHLSFAGLAELIISGGVFAYLQKTNLPLLTRAGAPAAQAATPLSYRPLWAGLALLMILTPLGLLTVGSAWGEWSPKDFQNPAKRQQIDAASDHSAAPTSTPAGMEKLATVWTAPIPAYAPAVLRSTALGYMMSALLGGGVIILALQALMWMISKRERPLNGG
jgi:cobalt/nickel transport system permease protein